MRLRFEIEDLNRKAVKTAFYKKKVFQLPRALARGVKEHKDNGA